MSPPTPRPSTLKPPSPPGSVLDGELEELRDLLLAAERVRLNQIEARIARPLVDAPSLATVLPEAIRHRAQQDQQLAGALAPIIDETLIQAVHRSPKRVADALSPVMGPAIRKAVATALQSMIRSLNQTLEHSLSWKGLTWRWEAWRTGKSFGEVVLLHTLQYRVEHVFLIHRPTGIRLAYAGNGPALAGREDIVASMFSAIMTAVQRFAKDSFGVSAGSALQSFSMEDGLEVWVEQRDDALLAAVIRGIPPPALRATLQSALADISTEYATQLREFRGNSAPFDGCATLLHLCLRQALRAEERLHAAPPFRWSPALMLLLAVPLLMLLFWTWQQYQERQQWTAFFSRANDEPGLQINSVTREGTQATIRGLRDPLATDPMLFALQAGLPMDRVQFHLEPYLSLAPELILRRAAQALHPPTDVSLGLDEEQGAMILTAAGVASHEWTQQFLQVGPTIPGVAGIKYGRLQDRDLLRLQELSTRVGAREFLFERGHAVLAPDTASALHQLVLEIQNADRSATQLQRTLHIDIVGDASTEGAPDRNLQLADARARSVWDAIARESLPSTHVRRLNALALRANEPTLPEPAPRVFLRAIILESPPEYKPTP